MCPTMETCEDPFHTQICAYISQALRYRHMQSNIQLCHSHFQSQMTSENDVTTLRFEDPAAMEGGKAKIMLM